MTLRRIDFAFSYMQRQPHNDDHLRRLSLHHTLYRFLIAHTLDISARFGDFATELDREDLQRATDRQRTLPDRLSANKLTCRSARKSHRRRDGIESADSKRRIRPGSTETIHHTVFRSDLRNFAQLVDHSPPFFRLVQSSFRSAGLARTWTHLIEVCASEHNNRALTPACLTLCLFLALPRRSRCSSCHLSASERRHVLTISCPFSVLRLLLRRYCLLLIARIVSPA